MKKISDFIKKNKKKIFIITFILFSLRLLFLILVPPYIGIANNGDFQRLSLTVGIDYSYDPWLPENTFDSFFNYFVNDYKFVNIIDSTWNQPFTLFLKMAIHLCNRTICGIFDIRFVGIVNCLFYLFSILIFVKLIYDIKSKWCYFFLFLLYFILGDTYIIQYFNSFYTEIGTVFSYLVVLGLFIYGMKYTFSSNLWKRYLSIVLITFFSYFAILSKQQDILTFFPFLICILVLLKKYGFKLYLRILYTIIFTFLISYTFINNPAGGNVTTYNVIMMDILSNSEKPEEQLKTIVKDQSDYEIIAKEIGNNAFNSTINWEDFEEYFTRKNEVVLLAHEPKVFFKMVNIRSKKLFLDDNNLGNYLKKSGSIPHEKTSENRLWYNIKNKIYVHNIYFYLLFLLASVSVFFIGSKLYHLSNEIKDILFLYLLLPISNLLRFITVILGDSSHDDYKHFFALNVEFDIIFILTTLAFGYFIFNCIKKRSIKNEKV